MKRRHYRRQQALIEHFAEGYDQIDITVIEKHFGAPVIIKL